MSDRANVPTPPAPLTPEQVVEWLRYVTTELYDRRAEILPALTAMAEAHREIEEGDEETAGAMAENIRMGKSLAAAAKRAHDEHKRPYLDAGKAVDGWQEHFLSPVNGAIVALTKTLLAFQMHKANAERVAREIAAAEAKAEADRLAEQANAALQQGKRDAPAMLTASLEADEVAQQAADEAMKRTADMSRTRGVYGAVASTRTTWTWEITDFDALPLEFKTVNEAAIKASMKARDRRTGRPLRTIPGLAWVEQHSLGVR